MAKHQQECPSITFLAWLRANNARVVHRIAVIMHMLQTLVCVVHIWYLYQGLRRQLLRVVS